MVMTDVPDVPEGFELRRWADAGWVRYSLHVAGTPLDTGRAAWVMIATGDNSLSMVRTMPEYRRRGFARFLVMLAASRHLGLTGMVEPQYDCPISFKKLSKFYVSCGAVRFKAGLMVVWPIRKESA